MIELAVAGAAGRMGTRIVALASADDRFRIVAALERSGHPFLGVDIGELTGLTKIHVPVQTRLDTDFDVLVDFSLPEGTMHILATCLKRKRPVIIGTTGHTAEQQEAILAASRDVAVLKATNMSVGVNLIFKLAAQVAATLGEEYDIEIVEAHHRFKLDAPSGTAITLRDEIAAATGRNAENDVIYGRQGHTGKRPHRQIGMHSLRIGDTVGEHEVHFGNMGETVTLKHTAHTRDTFVKGALRAAAWIADKPPGLYNMFDVLGMK